MSNKIFLDSSILVEYDKDTKTQLLNSFLENENSECFINETVVSEFLFHFIKFATGKAPLTAKSAKKIPDVFNLSKGYMLMQLFSYLPTTIAIFELVPEFMEKYNLLPNDAIILATCKIHNIAQLASHDLSDFTKPCIEEGITLLTG